MGETEFLTTAEVSTRYRVNEVTLRRWIADGDFIRPIRVGRLFRFRICDLVAWEDSRREVAE